jgi:uncharacterized protein with PIN domain
MMVSRIQKAYESQFRALLEQTRARRLEQGVQWLLARARELSSREHIPLTDSIARVYERVAAKPSFKKRNSSGTLFFCDAGLGGLARWLRAAGHDAKWQPDIDDDELLLQARKLSATILTTDSMLMERRLLRDRIIPALWLPPTLKIPEQLAVVFREFGLAVGEPRCMNCGGELIRGDKEALQERIPPRTYRWLDEYFVCARCGKLFWRGTHWERIRGTLSEIMGDSRS